MLETQYRTWKVAKNLVQIKFKPKLDIFNVIGLDDDIVALMNTRVVELTECFAKCPGGRVKVFSNGKRIEAKSIDICEIDSNASQARRRFLILVEGKSAKGFVLSGLSADQHKACGLFCLGGKVMNVKQASGRQSEENDVLNKFMSTLGLKKEVSYENEDEFKSLLYDHILIMVDPHDDGTHIKGLVINFIHQYWPKLFRRSGFILDFITPVAVATHVEEETKEFYTNVDYKNWVENEGEKIKNWKIKSFKGLARHVKKEAKLYLGNFDKYTRKFVWVNDDDGEAIELAFGGDIKRRKSWLENLEVQSTFDFEKKSIRYHDFVHHELKRYFIVNIQRSIPTMLDGLRRINKKILHTTLEENLIEPIGVCNLAGRVSHKTSYLHRSTNIRGAIVSMAQNFVGSNNVNLLVPDGQFGSRMEGPNVYSNPEYIDTHLADITPKISRKEDNVFLNYLYAGGESIEPERYMPIIPYILVNGCNGIATGYRSSVLRYNVKDIIKNLKLMLRQEITKPNEMIPWYKDFIGEIKKISTKESKYSEFTANGTIEIKDDDDGNDFITFKINELPIYQWTEPYIQYLECLKTNNFIEGYDNWSSDNNIIDFRGKISKKNSKADLIKKFKLNKTLRCDTMVLIDEENKLFQYPSPEAIIESYYPLRLALYAKHKEREEETYANKIKKLANEIKYIKGVIKDNIVLTGDKARDEKLLRDKDFTQFDSSYDYLLLMEQHHFQSEAVKKRKAEKCEAKEKLELWKKETAENMWLRQLEDLEKALE